MMRNLILDLKMLSPRGVEMADKSSQISLKIAGDSASTCQEMEQTSDELIFLVFFVFLLIFPLCQYLPLDHACVRALGTLSGQASPSCVSVFIARPLTRKQSLENKTMRIF